MTPTCRTDRALHALWLLDARDVSGTTLARVEGWLSASERARWATQTRSPRREQFLLGRALLRLAIAESVGRAPAEIDATEVADRPPTVTVPRGATPWFSLSHSHHWIACAVSSASAIGVDVEVLDAKRDVVALSEWRFHREEHAWLLQQPERSKAFYRLWTGKEAMVKLRSQLLMSAELGDVRFEVSGAELRAPPPAKCWHSWLSGGELAVSVVGASRLAAPVVRHIGALRLGL